MAPPSSPVVFFALHSSHDQRQCLRDPHETWSGGFPSRSCPARPHHTPGGRGGPAREGRGSDRPRRLWWAHVALDAPRVGPGERPPPLPPRRPPPPPPP